MSGIKGTGRKAEDTKRCADFGGAVDSFYSWSSRENPKQGRRKHLGFLHNAGTRQTLTQPIISFHLHCIACWPRVDDSRFRGGSAHDGPIPLGRDACTRQYLVLGEHKPLTT